MLDACHPERLRLVVNPGFARSRCGAVNVFGQSHRSCSTLSPIAAARSVTSLPDCHAGLTLLPFASLPRLLVEPPRSRRVRDARLWSALRASQHPRFRRRRDDARVGKMPLANLCNRSCCQRALLGATDLRATGSHPPVRRGSRSPQVPHASTGREVLNGSAREARIERVVTAPAHPHLAMRATPTSNRGTVGAVSASCGWLLRTRPALSSGGVGRASLARPKPASACSAANASPRKPSTDASCRAADRTTDSSSTAVLSVRLPRTVPSARRELRVSPHPVGPFPHAAHHRCRFPGPKRLLPMSPSAPA